MAELPGGVRGYTKTVMITIFFSGGSFYPSNTLDGILHQLYSEFSM